MIRFQLNNAVDVKTLEEKYSEDVKRINRMINEKTGAGNDY